MNTKPQSTTLSHDGQGCIMARAKHGSHRVLIAKCEPDGMEYAALIVRALNRDHAFDALLCALRECNDLLANSDVRFKICDGGKGNLGEHSTYHRAINASRAAFKSAKPFTH